MSRTVLVALLLWLAMPTAHSQPAQEVRAIQQEPARPQAETQLGQERTDPGPALARDQTTITVEEGELQGTRIRARGVVVRSGEYTLTGGSLEGDTEGELLFSGSPTLTFRGQTLVGEVIRFRPRTREYRVESLRSALSPEFLQGQLLSPLILHGGSISGRHREPIDGWDLDCTTCDRPLAHYLLRATSVTVIPGRRVILRKATIRLWNRNLVTLPTLIIPLDARPRHSGYTPEVGRSQDEGLFVKAAFNYVLSDRAPGLYRVDLMEKKGLGLGLEQEWSAVRAAGLLALYVMPFSGSGQNLSSRLGYRQSLGGGQTLALSNDLTRNSYLSLPQTTSLATRLGYTRQLAGANTSLNLSRSRTTTASSQSTSYGAALSQTLAISRAANLTANADYSQYSTSAGTFAQRTEQLAARLQGDLRAPNYLLQLQANRNVPIGRSTAQSYFGGVEKLPEVTLSNYRFTAGPLARAPVSFSLSAGQYSEGTTISGTQTRQKAERVVGGLEFSNTRYALSSSTELSLSGGFQQYFYSEGSAQYVLRNNASLSQRLGKRSGINVNYTYQRPEGGTPFRFDSQGQFHALAADAGWMDDRRVQLSVRMGYDFAQSRFEGFNQPWQTVSANLLVRPNDSWQVRNLLSFDPNTGRFLSTTSDLRIRGSNDLALDVVARYDPRRSKIGQANAYASIPIGRLWRVNALVQYNGYLNRFESRNLQIIRDLHCLEAALTYSDNPFGYRAERQIYFQLRIKALPLFQRFGAGPFGQALDTSIGERF